MALAAVGAARAAAMLKSAAGLRLPADWKKAVEIQNELAERVRIVPLKRPPRFIAGVDAAFLKDNVIAAACLFKWPELTLIEEARSIRRVRTPYIPGFLSFREGPAVISAIRKLRQRPDVILFDGQGIAHPRGLGIASFVGVLLDTPSIGCAKTRLCGAYEKEPRGERGGLTPLTLDGKTVGAVVRTKDNTRPVFVSPGHLIDVKGSISIALNAAAKYRLPEPIRQADMLSKKIKAALQNR